MKNKCTVSEYCSETLEFEPVERTVQYKYMLFLTNQCRIININDRI